MAGMKFSIVVPTYNEQKDITDTLEALIALDYPDKEILIVDDSTDCTPEIISKYLCHGVRLIHPGGGGRCEARNKGIREATGEVVCILNADVRPRKDFLQRLLAHYEKGADYVLVASNVINQSDLFARYVASQGEKDYCETTWMEWTEGFSCRKENALRAGLFPVGFLVPICAGEDGFFGTGLRNTGAKKVTDLSIVVDHVAPGSFCEYWQIRKGRGVGSVQIHRFLDKWSLKKILVWNILKTVRTIVYLVTIIPTLANCWRIARYSKRGTRDTFPFLYAWVLEKVAFHVGEWQSTFQIMDKERSRNHATSGG